MESVSTASSQSRCNFSKPREHMRLQPFHLSHDNPRVFAVLLKRLHHRAEEGLRESRGAVERFLDRQRAGALRTPDFFPQLLKEHDRVTPVAPPLGGSRDVQETPACAEPLDYADIL